MWPEGSQHGGVRAQGGWETLPVARPQPLSGPSCPCLPMGTGVPPGFLNPQSLHVAPAPRACRLGAAPAGLVGGTAALSGLLGSLQPERLTGAGGVLNEEQAPWWPVLVSEEVRRQADRLS